jgi:hypothetical protein
VPDWLIDWFPSWVMDGVDGEVIAGQLLVWRRYRPLDMGEENLPCVY